ncbi:astaxanthin synthase [Phaffia rhodozyma]|uniref:Astaxanthin synthase n=1 Tax=Phaffia rhodozyma TaxID=264483 RepID=A0A0F7SLU6_PHARH|nr:astaxanthin synthase [Phaffia rhodozyma]
MSFSVLQIVIDHPGRSAGLALGLIGLAVFVDWFHLAPRRSPLYNLPGPRLESYLYGNAKDIIKLEVGVAHSHLEAVYGPTFVYRGMLGQPRLYSADPKVFNHLMSQAYDYPKPWHIRKVLGSIVGDGLLSSEGETHRRQRRIILPAFSAQAIRELFPIFLDKAMELTEKMTEEAAKKDGPTDGSEAEGEKAGPSRLVSEGVDVMFWIGRAMLDVIGLAGFDYDFDSIEKESNELSIAYKTMFDGLSGQSTLGVLQDLFPVLNYIRTERQAIRERAMMTVNRYGRDILARKKKAVLDLSVGVDGGKGLGKADVQGKDILSSLVRANMATDLAEQNRLGDEEVLAQISTLLLAGFETSSTALTWMLHSLSTRPEIQNKLRDELLKVETSEPSLDELNALPYLDAFVKESLRFTPPAPGTMRVAAKDDIISLSEPIKGRDGKLMTEIYVPKGTTMFVPIMRINRAAHMYGKDDADIFRPERWLEPMPRSVMDLDVPYGHQATFLGGPRGCIGYRFALAEIKAFLFVILRQLTFESVVPAIDYEHRANMVQRPRVKGKKEEGFHMKLQVRSVKD